MSKTNGFFNSFAKTVLYLEGMNLIRGVHEEISFFGKRLEGFLL